MTARGSIAFVDDEPELCEAAKDWLEASGFAVETWTDPRRAEAEIVPGQVEAVITDLRMPGLPGDQLMARLRLRDPDLPVVLMSAHADVPIAVAALRDGAHDFIEKPYNAEHLLSVLDRAVEWSRMRREVQRLRATQGGRGRIEAQLPGASPAMRGLREAVERLAPLPLDLVILGEAGTGREKVARLAHEISGRGRRPFVALDCAAIPQAQLEIELFGYERGALPGMSGERHGKFEYCNGGTLYLSEIEALSTSLQMMIFRVLQEKQVARLGAGPLRPVDVRVIAASQEPLAEVVAQGRFRQDLGFRLTAGEIRVAALRERPEDIPLLVSHHLAEAAARFRRPEPQLTTSELAQLKSRAWPGNLLELQAYAEKLVLGLQAALTVSGSSPLLQPGQGLQQQVAAFEASLIAEALLDSGGAVAVAAERLGVPRRTLAEKIARLGVKGGG